MAESKRTLVTRVVSALVLLPGVLVLGWLGGWYFAALVAAAAGVCAWEFAGIAVAPDGKATRVLLVALAAALPLVFLAWPPHRIPWIPTILFPSLAVVFLAVNLLAPGEGLGLVPSRAALSVFGVLYTGGLLSFAVLLRQIGPQGPWWLLMLLAVTWLNDTGAYFAGRAFGGHKLYPRIFPGKAWEGLAGGIVASVGGAFFAWWVGTLVHVRGVAPLDLEAWQLLVAGLVTGVVGPLGDLSESLLKRAYGVKDSGRIMPGHGGILDRIDALLFNAAVLYLWAVLVTKSF